MPAKAINKISGFAVKDVGNPLRAHSGADGESIDDGLIRIPGELRRRDRAVTAGDFKELALATPGAAVGRARVPAALLPPVADFRAGWGGQRGDLAQGRSEKSERAAPGPRSASRCVPVPGPAPAGHDGVVCYPAHLSQGRLWPSASR